ncbi:MAG: hypothetical protein Q9220_006241 [cf. Caloplaca sp. 1 TL-2023]
MSEANIKPDAEAFPPHHLPSVAPIESSRMVLNPSKSRPVCPDITQHPFDTGILLQRDYLDQLRPIIKNDPGAHVSSRTLQSLVNNAAHMCTGLGDKSQSDILSGVAGIQDTLVATCEFLQKNDQVFRQCEKDGGKFPNLDMSISAVIAPGDSMKTPISPANTTSDGENPEPPLPKRGPKGCREVTIKIWDETVRSKLRTIGDSTIESEVKKDLRPLNVAIEKIYQLGTSGDIRINTRTKSGADRLRDRWPGLLLGKPAHAKPAHSGQIKAWNKWQEEMRKQKSRA